MPRRVQGVVVYNVAESAKKLGVSEFTVRNYIHQGMLAAEKNGKSYQIPKNTLLDFLKHKGEITRKPGRPKTVRQGGAPSAGKRPKARGKMVPLSEVKKATQQIAEILRGLYR